MAPLSTRLVPSFASNSAASWVLREPIGSTVMREVYRRGEGGYLKHTIADRRGSERVQAYGTELLDRMAGIGPAGWGLVLVAPFVGSFLGVVIRRLPVGSPIAWARSRCEKCGAR